MVKLEAHLGDIMTQRFDNVRVVGDFTEKLLDDLGTSLILLNEVHKVTRRHCFLLFLNYIQILIMTVQPEQIKNKKENCNLYAIPNV